MDRTVSMEYTFSGQLVPYWQEGGWLGPKSEHCRLPYLSVYLQFLLPPLSPYDHSSPGSLLDSLSHSTKLLIFNHFKSQGLGSTPSWPQNLLTHGWNVPAYFVVHGLQKKRGTGNDVSFYYGQLHSISIYSTLDHTKPGQVRWGYNLSGTQFTLRMETKQNKNQSFILLGLLFVHLKTPFSQGWRNGSALGGPPEDLGSLSSMHMASYDCL